MTGLGRDGVEYLTRTEHRCHSLRVTTSSGRSLRPTSRSSTGHKLKPVVLIVEHSLEYVNDSTYSGSTSSPAPLADDDKLGRGCKHTES